VGILLYFTQPLSSTVGPFWLLIETLFLLGVPSPVVVVESIYSLDAPNEVD